MSTPEDEDIPEWARLNVGDKYRYGKKLFHVRAIVDGDQIVVRIWSRRRQTWVYSVEWRWFIEDCIAKERYDGIYRKVTK